MIGKTDAARSFVTAVDGAARRCLCLAGLSLSDDDDDDDDDAVAVVAASLDSSDSALLHLVSALRISVVQTRGCGHQ